MRHATVGVPYKKVELPKTISQRSETVRQSPGKFWPAIFFLYMVGVAGCNPLPVPSSGPAWQDFADPERSTSHCS